MKNNHNHNNNQRAVQDTGIVAVGNAMGESLPINEEATTVRMTIAINCTTTATVVATKEATLHAGAVIGEIVMTGIAIVTVVGDGITITTIDGEITVIIIGMTGTPGVTATTEVDRDTVITIILGTIRID